MKKITLLLVILFSAVFAFAQQINDENAEVREAKNFHGISVSNAFEVYLSQGNEETVAVSASEQKFKERIKVEVKNGILRISFDNDKKFWKGFNGDRMKLKAYISFKSLDKINLSGASNLRLKGTLTGDNLSVHFSGASDWKEGEVNVKKLTVDMSGASRIDISGKAANMEVDASGASDFRGYDFATDYCDAKASGASSINITVNKELSANASGASSVHFKGEGLIRNIHTSGASRISKKS